jgi:hypothetical protein
MPMVWPDIDINQQCYKVNNTVPPLYGLHRVDYTTPGGTLYRKIRVTIAGTEYEPYIKANDLTPVETAKCGHIPRDARIITLRTFSPPGNNDGHVYDSMFASYPSIMSGGIIKRRYKKTRKMRKHRKSKKSRKQGY